MSGIALSPTPAASLLPTMCHRVTVQGVAQARVNTQRVGRVAAPPDADGWQASYEIGVQGDELVVTTVTVASPVWSVGSDLSIAADLPRGGLTAQRARALITPGSARDGFLAEVARGKPTPWLTRSQIRELYAAAKSKGYWRAEPTAEFANYIGYLRTLPALQALVRGQPADRRQRLAQTAALYVEACRAGRADPRPWVAKRQGRKPAAVRDDLYLARHESPPLLTATRPRGKAGGELTREALRILEEMNEAAKKARPKRKGGKR